MITHKVDIPIEVDFPYKFVEHGVFHTEYYDNSINFILYRAKLGDDFKVFEFKINGDSLGLPQTWSINQEVLDTPKNII